ncbi:MAG: Smr/MutS family protein [Sphingomonas sp.]
MASVRPRGDRATSASEELIVAMPDAAKPPPSARTPPPTPLATPKAAPRGGPGTTLDGRWDKRLATGAVSPDSSIDLHGHTLDTAHARLDTALEHAIRRGDRVLLLITGKPPVPESERPHARGRIRAAIGDWLAASRHAPHIASVRSAHARHGGAGALYLILRRSRDRATPIY